MTTQHTPTPAQIERARLALIDCQGYEPSARDLRLAALCVANQDRISASITKVAE
jgi:hypothetical protein